MIVASSDKEWLQWPIENEVLETVLSHLKDVRAQKFLRTDFFKLWLQVENDKIRLKT